MLTQFPGGAPLGQIRDTLATDLPRRTLQRRLENLVNQGRVTVTGIGRATRYRLAAPAAPAGTPLPPLEASGYAETYVSTTPEGDEIHALVRQPLQARHAVGYNRDFLDAYRPNETRYLTNTHRRRLLELGRSYDGERPPGTYAREIANRLLIDLSWNSSRLEGNTYSLLETERLLELGESAEGKDAREAQTEYQAWRTGWR